MIQNWTDLAQLNAERMEQPKNSHGTEAGPALLFQLSILPDTLQHLEVVAIEELYQEFPMIPCFRTCRDSGYSGSDMFVLQRRTRIVVVWKDSQSAISSTEIIPVL